MAILIEAPSHAVSPVSSAPPLIRLDPASNPPNNPWIVAISVMLATFMEVLDTTITSVALPYIAGSMAASPRPHG